MNHVPLPHAKWPPPNILSVPPPLRYITFGTSWSSANALQISHFCTAYVQSRSANKHCNTAYMQSRSANKHCNTAYMQSRSANSHGHCYTTSAHHASCPIILSRWRCRRWMRHIGLKYLGIFQGIYSNLCILSILCERMTYLLRGIWLIYIY